MPAYTGGPGASAFSVPDDNQPGTTTNYANQRTTSVSDALGNTTTTSLGVECGWAAPTDTTCYTFASTQDASQHATLTETDGWGRTVVTQADSGTGTSGDPYAVYAITSYRYDDAGRVVRLVAPDYTHTTSFTYDAAGRQTGMSDPDRGTESYVYDPNGNLTHASDARGQLVYTGYDGINRPLWRNTSPSPTGASVSYSYDSTAGGNVGIGHVTGESFNGGAGGTALGAGSYAYTYDERGQQTQETITLGGTTPTAATFTTAYDDSGQPTSLTYPDGEVLSLGRDSASDWLTSAVTTPAGGGATNLLTNISYSGLAGASQQPTGASVAGGTYTYAASYDSDLRLTSTSLTRVSDGTTLFGSARTYDALGNVTSVSTTLPAGTDNQAFCYDEFSRLTWASSASGSTPCGGTNTAGTLTAPAAQYTQPFSYDNLGRLTSGPLGPYTYGDPAHLHAATSIGSGSTQYTASYDASGAMLCRAPTGATTCAGSSPTGAQMSYDNEGRLTGWQNAPTNPTSTASFAYDGEGNRVASVSSNSPTTYYLSSWEEITGSTVTKYYPVGAGAAGLAGLPQPVKVGSSISYLAADGLGSMSEAVDGAGNVLAQELYAPYGGVRYSSGTMPTTKGFTGQRADVVTGLDYYTARYYDPLAGQFTSADTVLPGNGYDLWGLSRYAYVEGNPESRTDPSGHCWLVCAAIAAVVTTVAVTAGTALVQYATTGNVNWGQAATMGLTAGVTVGAVMALGPLAGPAIDALVGGEGIAGAAGAVGDAVATGLADDGAMVASSAVADKVAVGAATGGIMGAGEGFAQGWAAGDRGGALALDTVTGMAGGTVGGAAGASIPGPFWLSGAFGNGAGNLAGQAISHVTHGTGFDGLSFGASLVFGGLAGHATGANLGNPVINAFVAAALDFGSQFAESLRNQPVRPSAVPHRSVSQPPNYQGYRSWRGVW